MQLRRSSVASNASSLLWFRSRSSDSRYSCLVDSDWCQSRDNDGAAVARCISAIEGCTASHAAPTGLAARAIPVAGRVRQVLT
jgi:hypothetical protein